MGLIGRDLDKGDGRMAGWRRPAILGALLVFAAAGSGWAQEAGTSSGRGLRVSWTVDPPRNGFRAVCGFVYNEQYSQVRNVRLNIDRLDSSGRVISTRTSQVTGDVAPSGRNPFCALAEDGAAKYTIRVLDVEPGFGGGQ